MAISSMTNIHCAGALFLAQSTQRFLFLERAQGRTAGTWGLAGGKQEPNDATTYEALLRECQEELGFVPNFMRLVPIEKFTTIDGAFAYHTFYCSVEQEFVPKLNHEHLGYAWIDSGTWPKPMHPGLWSTINFDAVRDKILTLEQQQ